MKSKDKNNLTDNLFKELAALRKRVAELEVFKDIMYYK